MFCFACFLGGRIVLTPAIMQELHTLSETRSILEGRLRKQLYEHDEIKLKQAETTMALLRTLPQRDVAIAKAALLRARRSQLRQVQAQLLDQLTWVGQRLLILCQPMSSHP